MTDGIAIKYGMAISLSSLDSYMNIIRNIPVLTAAQEYKLAKKYYTNGDLKAVRKLIMSHLRFVAYIAKGYSGYGLSQADLIQEGNIGLMQAVKRFNPDKGVKLISFAVHWIKSAINDFIIKNFRLVKVATTKAQRKLFFNLRSAKKSIHWLNSQELSSIANDLQVTPTDVRVMEERMLSKDVSFDPKASDDPEFSIAAPGDYITDKSLSPELEFEFDAKNKKVTKELYAALTTLDERSQNIINMRWFNDKKSTLHELAHKFSISAERVRQIEQQAFAKMRAILKNTNLAY